MAGVFLGEVILRQPFVKRLQRVASASPHGLNIVGADYFSFSKLESRITEGIDCFCRTTIRLGGRWRGWTQQFSGPTAGVVKDLLVGKVVGRRLAWRGDDPCEMGWSLVTSYLVVDSQDQLFAISVMDQDRLMPPLRNPPIKISGQHHACQCRVDLHRTDSCHCQRKRDRILPDTHCLVSRSCSYQTEIHRHRAAGSKANKISRYALASGSARSIHLPKCPPHLRRFKERQRFLERPDGIFLPATGP